MSGLSRYKTLKIFMAGGDNYPGGAAQPAHHGGRGRRTVQPLPPGGYVNRETGAISAMQWLVSYM